MGTVIPAGFAEAVFRHSAAGDPDEMLCTFGLAVEVGAVDYVEMANSLMDAWTSNVLAPIWGGTYSCPGVLLRVSEIGFPPTVYESTNPPYVSTGSNSYTPQNSAYLVKKGTASGGRANRGRVYVPGIIDSAVNNVGQIAVDVMTDLQAGVTSFRLDAELITDLISLVVLHAEDSPAVTPTPIISLVVDSVMATQRRRLR